jgi:gamma-glutamyltranspeptidase/glutathione hydrolase
MQPDLAATLDRVMLQGHDGFYRGETARLIAEEMKRGNGLITEEDLARYQAVERVPIRGTFNGYEVISMPPPSSGGIALVQMLNILEGFDLSAMGHGTPAFWHHVTEAQRLAYRDRAAVVGDADFADVPIEKLTSKEYAAELRAKVDPHRATVSTVEDVVLAAESLETTHYSVVDSDGMAVSVTYTLEAGYGSEITVTGGGFLLNNEMGDFNPWPGLTTESGQIGTEANLTRPEQRMLSSMTPTILARDGQLVAIVGSPGGRTIINTVLHLVLNITEFGMDGTRRADVRKPGSGALDHGRPGDRRKRSDTGPAVGGRGGGGAVGDVSLLSDASYQLPVTSYQSIGRNSGGVIQERAAACFIHEPAALSDPAVRW